jgi:CRP/FNR family cyclic AMP-dependent transcriptional regulator
MTTPWTRLFGYKKDKEASELPTTQLLSRVPIFEELSRRELAAIERILHERTYIQDEVIFRAGEPGMGMYIVQNGRVAIVSEPHDQQLYEMENGDFFGEVALLDEGPRSATAIARTNCSVFGFFKPDLFVLIERDPRLGLKIVLRLAKHIGSRLRQADDWVLALTHELETMKRSRDEEVH